MKKAVLVAVVCSLGLLFVAGSGPTKAATPGSGSISAGSPEVSWSGGPFTLPGTVSGCTGDDDISCDHYRLSVTAPAGQAIEVFGAGETFKDDIAVYVYLDNVRLAGQASGSNQEDIFFAHAGGTLTYDVRIQPSIFGPLIGTYSALARFTDHSVPVDVETQDCSQLFPGVVDIAETKPVDDGRQISLDVAIVEDTTVTVGGREVQSSVVVDRAAQIVQTAKQSYAPLGIDFNAVSYTPAALTGDDAGSLTTQAKALFGGRRPSNADVVFTMTAQDIQADGNYAVAGLADCIGGVQYPDGAFAVGEVAEAEGFSIAGVKLYENLNAKVIAHEIGHLMGAHHHYANCVESAGSLAARELGPCTLMAPFADFLTLKFGSVESAFIRTKAFKFAQP